ncbi:MAG: GBP-domain-containing protein [Monoraphidium minutum]|nr:MAG: GBP-domain-containing protein [Monoraphidium minutum]
MAQYPEGDAGPVQLIRFNEATGDMEVCEDAARLLRTIRTPVGVVAVCGRARTGKSFILNQLLGRGAGFRLAHSHRPCTKGLWIWSRPVRLVGPDGQPYHLILLDSEGIDAYNQTAQDGVQLLSLAVLLSSMFVFNQMGPIDEAAIDRLGLVTEITKHIRVRASEGGAGEGALPVDGSELGAFTPTFLWLLRDFYFDLSDEGRQVSAREYLEAALSPQDGSSAAILAKNNIRASIKGLFPDRDCFTLVRPATDEAALRRLDEADPASLRPQFVEGVSRLTSMLFSRAAPKRIGSQIINGPMLAGLAHAYVSAINAGAVPTIATAWQGVAEAECRRAAAAAEEAYRREFDAEGVPPEPDALLAEHRRALHEAKRVFKAGAVGDPRVRSQHKDAFLAAAQRHFELHRDRALARAEAAAEAMLSDAAGRLSTAARLKESWPEQTENAPRWCLSLTRRWRGTPRRPRAPPSGRAWWPSCSGSMRTPPRSGWRARRRRRRRGSRTSARLRVRRF